MQTQKVVEIVAIPVTADKIGCSSPKCDGRPARWAFPQSPKHIRPKFVNSKELVDEHMTSCNVHLAALADVVQTWYVEATPIPGTGCDDFSRCESRCPVDNTVRCEVEGEHTKHKTASGLEWYGGYAK